MYMFGRLRSCLTTIGSVRERDTFISVSVWGGAEAVTAIKGALLTYQTGISLRQHQQSPPCFLQLLSQQECLLLKASVSIETQYASYHYLNYSRSNTANLLIHQRVEGANDDSNSHVGISKGHQEHCQTFGSSSSHTYKNIFSVQRRQHSFKLPWKKALKPKYCWQCGSQVP